MPHPLLQSAEDVWHHHCLALEEALGQASRDLQNLLRLDDYHRHGHEEDKLAHALGPFASNTLNLSALSEVLDKRGGGRGMAPERRERVESLIRTLEEHRQSCAKSDPECPVVDIEAGERSILEQAEQHLNRMAGVFRSLRMAQLEVRSKYAASVHDCLFAQFNWRQLSPAELRLCPPFIVAAEIGSDPGPTVRLMMSLLESRMPLKIAAFRSSLRRHYPTTADASVPATMAIEMIPLAMRGVHFVQTCPAAPDFAKRVFEGLTSPRPGIVSVLVKKDGADEASSLRKAERAVRSRAFPVMIYDPDRERGFVTCFDLSANPEPTATWLPSPASEAEGEADEDAGVAVEPFTFAHFAAGEAEFADAFSDPQPGTSPLDLVPIAQYLELNRRQRVGKIPCVRAPGPDGLIRTRVASPAVVLQTSDQLHLWRTLQEISGVDNPHVSTTKAELHAEMDAQQKALLQSLQADMEQTQAHLERVAVASTVRRIVSRLTGVDAEQIDLQSLMDGGGGRPHT